MHRSNLTTRAPKKVEEGSRKVKTQTYGNMRRTQSQIPGFEMLRRGTVAKKSVCEAGEGKSTSFLLVTPEGT